MKSIQFLIITLVVLLTTSTNIKAQLTKKEPLPSDTLKIELTNPHSPNKAALFSAVIPGLGQVYNKKYWKVPIVYATIGTTLYFGFSNQKNFKKYRSAYKARLDNDPTTIDEFEGSLTNTALESNIDFYQRNRDLSFILAGVFYVLNIVDAAVDAHLFNFPKNDNLSFNLQPNLELTQNNQVSKGFKLVINL
ncbi:MAG: DUF5683 domain-containing protein [Vicingaceae bacterium]